MSLLAKLYEDLAYRTEQRANAAEASGRTGLANNLRTQSRRYANLSDQAWNRWSGPNLSVSNRTSEARQTRNFERNVTASERNLQSSYNADLRRQAQAEGRGNFIR